jgi:hypothetical protein
MFLATTTTTRISWAISTNYWTTKLSLFYWLSKSNWSNGSKISKSATTATVLSWLSTTSAASTGSNTSSTRTY